MANSVAVAERLSTSEVLNCSPAELAIKLGCAPGQLNGLMRERFGYSLMALRLELRLRQAAGLLQKPVAAVEAVADQCGFGDVNLFGACFEKRFGVPPENWHKQDPAVRNTGPVDRRILRFVRPSAIRPGRSARNELLAS